ncbi:MAG: ABC transporter, substrate-binding protein (cluster 1, maltose/g3p/polyamine/iron) [uncultured Thermomicrobiales bacterium]|uniref:sn-glycerol-3-phosphate-binding periplasmic protein UgpB n=1 Tax=uncultured Thermomicrobiales bacterium TaxID=1645740 RepID=A0A6J4US46_9BACT|nr:MAG: ABC transporter, substrate-binding protein (cluster 1, maltose/g3p/polyamine/iron) [uncultured Thermomicrobiales bacterium]
MNDRKAHALLDEARKGRYDRRQILKRGVALGLSAPAIAAVVAAAAPRPAFGQTANSNPLGVDPAAPLDVVIFKGGYGDDYAIYVKDSMYARDFPEAEITYAGIQRLGEQLQPRFVAGEPPDIIDNSGAGALDAVALIADGRLADLGDLMAAPSYDTEGATFAETLLGGTQEQGVFDGKQFTLNYVVSVLGVWYSRSFMESKGYTYPKTWTEMLELSEEIKASGMSPWVTTGVHTQYIRQFMFDQMLWKHDPQALVDIDNLEADAWKSPAVQDVLEALYQLAERDLLLPGWDGLDHTQSQAEWLQNRAAFIPVGSWLENEMKDLIPEGFDMVVAPTPSLEGDKIPFEGIFAGAGEPFIVPAQGKNVAGGKEYLRMLFSKEGGRTFSELTQNLTVVNGAADDVEFGVATASVQAAIAAAGENTFNSRYGGWYKDLADEVKQQFAELMQKQISIEEFMDASQEAADAVKDDEGIQKFTREL